MSAQDFLHKINGVSCRLDEEKETKNIDKVVDILKEAKQDKKQVFICGNGGSAGTATHMACDLFKIGGLRAISLNENVPLLTALTNDEGWGSVYVYQLERLYNKGDILIAFSVHGGSGKDKAGLWSQNILQAVEFVKKNNGIVIGFTGFDGGVMKKVCDVCINVPVNSTPLVEAFHVVLHHYIAFELQEDLPCIRK